MIDSSFTNKKVLKFVITLGDGAQFSSNPGITQGNTVVWEGYKSSADITNAGGSECASLKARVFGVSQSDAAAVTTLSWKRTSYISNTIDVYAIDGNQTTLVFNGSIVNAWPDYSNAPNVFMDILAVQLYTDAQVAADPRYYPGATDVATIVGQIANDIGLPFTNVNNVQRSITNEYLKGSNRDQLFKLAKDTGIGLFITPSAINITDSPSTPNNVDIIPIVNKTTGLVGYPKPEQFGINFRCVFNPLIVFAGQVTVETEGFYGNSTWSILGIHHMLNSVDPQNPSWFSDVFGYVQGVGAGT